MGTVPEIGTLVVIGGGIGGLCAAIEAAAGGCRVTLLERADRLGGKMRELVIGGRGVDSGPTVLTMLWTFEDLFAGAGRRLQDYLDLAPLDVLARHGWADGSRLDLFTDLDRSADAIATFAGAREADGYRRFCAHAERIYGIVEQPFLRSDRPSIRDVVAGRGLRGMLDFASIDWHRSMWRALGTFFHDPRLRQLFARYATYYGSSPFVAPATLNLIAHVERIGVWRIRGGMSRLVDALAELAGELGVEVRTGCSVDEVIVEHGRCVGVRFGDGHTRADAVIVNAAAQALDAGRFGSATRGAVGLPALPRSMSAVTWSMLARTRGFPLAHHNVFFSPDYQAEFVELERGPATQPTVYVCAHDRDEAGYDSASPITASFGEPERLLVLINAPAHGDDPGDTVVDRLSQIEDDTFAWLDRCGLTIDRSTPTTATTPADFERLFPGTGGALYGSATHSMNAPFQRPHARTDIPGLYLAGGGSHPGAGVPMVCLSGRIAARAVIEDLARSHR